MWEEVGGTTAADILAFSRCGPGMIREKGEGGPEREGKSGAACVRERGHGDPGRRASLLHAAERSGRTDRGCPSDAEPRDVVSPPGQLRWCRGHKTRGDSLLSHVAGTGDVPEPLLSAVEPRGEDGTVMPVRGSALSGGAQRCSVIVSLSFFDAGEKVLVGRFSGSCGFGKGRRGVHGDSGRAAAGTPRPGGCGFVVRMWVPGFRGVQGKTQPCLGLDGRDWMGLDGRVTHTAGTCWCALAV